MPEKVEDKVTSSRISEWLGGLGVPDPGKSLPTQEPQPEALPYDDEVILPDKHGYRQVVFESAAYKTLVSRLEREVALTPLADSDAMITIRRAILKKLRQKQHVSRLEDSQRFFMEFKTSWDPVGFIEDQYGDSERPEELLGRVITITGSMSDAQALPCSEYLRQTWPTTSPLILSAFADMIALTDSDSS